MCNMCLELESQARVEVRREWERWRQQGMPAIAAVIPNVAERRLVRAKLAQWACELLALLDKGAEGEKETMP